MKKKWIAVWQLVVLAVELRAVPGTRMRQKNRQWNCGPVGQMGQIQPKQEKSKLKNLRSKPELK